MSIEGGYHPIFDSMLAAQTVTGKIHTYNNLINLGILIKSWYLAINMIILKDWPIEIGHLRELSMSEIKEFNSGSFFMP